MARAVWEGEPAISAVCTASFGFVRAVFSLASGALTVYILVMTLLAAAARNPSAATTKALCFCHAVDELDGWCDYLLRKRRGEVGRKQRGGVGRDSICDIRGAEDHPKIPLCHQSMVA
jgi:hypothetical protein